MIVNLGFALPNAVTSSTLNEWFLILRGPDRRRRRGYGLRCLPDLLPDFVTSGASFGGVGNQARGRKFFAERAQSILQLIVRKPVAFGGDEQEFAAPGVEKA